MERRREPRFATGQSISAIVLDPGGKEGDRHIAAELVDVSGNGARLRTAEPIAIGAAVRVDTGDHAVLGEVCHCSKTAGGYLCGIQIDQVLSHLADLKRLMDAVIDAAPETPVDDRVPILRKRRQA